VCDDQNDGKTALHTVCGAQNDGKTVIHTMCDDQNDGKTALYTICDAPGGKDCLDRTLKQPLYRIKAKNYPLGGLTNRENQTTFT
jgi:hypothetical protein